MSLDQEKIIKNTKTYFETATKLGFMPVELMSFLGEAFIKAPATNMADYHNAFEGGLIAHLIKTATYAVKFNNSLPDDEKVNQDSLIKVCFLHQIGKANLYTPCTSEWHRKNQGKMYEFNQDLTSMRVSERSIYYAVSNGVKFTEEEYTAILNSDKIDDKISEYRNSDIGDILKMGNLWAIKNAKKLAK